MLGNGEGLLRWLKPNHAPCNRCWFFWVVHDAFVSGSKSPSLPSEVGSFSEAYQRHRCPQFLLREFIQLKEIAIVKA
ncbi:MAG: hypothetical protein JWO91_3729 [Acidobacteriaceae bacterium]|nr:hypothetical protein [Acidobacteriaceae bacterium]